MLPYVIRATILGTVFTAATSLAIGICFSIAWAGGLMPSLMLILPSFAIAGGMAGAFVGGRIGNNPDHAKTSTHFENR